MRKTGDLLGLSMAFAYELLARGSCLWSAFGRRIVVPKVALLQQLESASLGGRRFPPRRRCSIGKLVAGAEDYYLQHLRPCLATAPLPP
jgi:hypothetical protein